MATALTTMRFTLSYVLVEPVDTASITALARYGLGIGLCAVLIACARLRLPDYASIITYRNLVIAAISRYGAIRRVFRIEPFEVLRS